MEIPESIGYFKGNCQGGGMSFNILKECRYGPLLFNKNDWPIGTSLRLYGEYAMEELNFLTQLIGKDSLVIDAGANIGTHTVWFSRLADIVVAFEPQRIAFQTLCANVALNNCLNVHAFHAAVGKECGQILVPFRDQNESNNFGGVPLAGATEGEMEQLVTIDSLNLTRCDLIKADVEGMEADLLAGAEKTIAKFRPLLYMEADGAQAPDAMRILMKLFDYECYWHTPNLFNLDNIEKNPEDVFITNGNVMVSINMLCVPAERHAEVHGLKKIMSPDEGVPGSFAMPITQDANGIAYLKQINEKKELANV
jgi:FkbM family methyltransferase